MSNVSLNGSTKFQYISDKMRANTNLIIIILATAIKGEYLTQIEKDYLEKTSYAPVSTSINVYHNLNPVGVNFAYLEELNKFWPNVNLKNPMYVPILAATAIFKATLTGLNTFKEHFKQTSIEQCDILNLEPILELINKIIISFDSNDSNLTEMEKRNTRMKRTANTGNSFSAKLNKNLNKFKKTQNKTFLNKFYKDITDNICKPNSRSAKQFINQLNTEYNLNIDLDLIDKSNRNHKNNMLKIINNFVQSNYDFSSIITSCNPGSPAQQHTEQSTEQTTQRTGQVMDPSNIAQSLNIAKTLTQRFIHADRGNIYEIKNLYSTTITYLDQNIQILLFTIADLQREGIINTNIENFKSNNVIDKSKLKKYINSYFKEKYNYNPLKRPNDTDQGNENKKVDEENTFEGSGLEHMSDPILDQTNTFFDPENDNIFEQKTTTSNNNTIKTPTQTTNNIKIPKLTTAFPNINIISANNNQEDMEVQDPVEEDEEEIVKVPLPNGATHSFRIKKVIFGISEKTYNVQELFSKILQLYEDNKIQKSTLNAIRTIFQLTIQNISNELSTLFRHQPGLLNDNTKFCTHITLENDQYLATINTKFFKTTALRNKKIIEPITQCSPKTCLKLKKQRFIIDTFPPRQFCKILQESSNSFINFCDNFSNTKPPCFEYDYRDPHCSFYATTRPLKQKIAIYNVEYRCPKQQQCYYNDIHGKKIAQQALTHQMRNNQLDTHYNIIISQSLDFIHSIYNLLTVTITIIILGIQALQILFTLSSYIYKYFYVKESRKKRKKDKKRRKNNAYYIKHSEYQKRPRIIELTQMSSSNKGDKDLQEENKILLDLPHTTHK